MLIYILARLTSNTSYVFLGNSVSILASTMDHPVQQQELYQQLPCFKFNSDNVQEFMQEFLEVCNFWNVHNMVYQDVARPRDPEEAERWDHANGLALSKLKYYLDNDVYQMVWKGEDLTARQFYLHLHQMFLRATCDRFRCWSELWSRAISELTSP